MPSKLFTLLALFLTPLGFAHGETEVEQTPIDPDTGLKDWSSWHMRSEHHIQGFDGTTFFTIHDPESTGMWTSLQIRTLYGLLDKSTNHVSEADKDSLVAQVLGLFDANKDGSITLDEFREAWDDRGVRLPDSGMGPGHHGDDEYEYEIHHWEKYHGDDTKIEDLIHPEDIEHFRKHDKEDEEDEKWEIARGGDGTVVEKNIPAKFMNVEL
jgi:hypothetical protein